MAQHQSAKKRIRQTAVRRLRNRYAGKSTRNAIKQLLSSTEKGPAAEMLPKTLGMVDKLAKKNIIHANKAGHIKSRLNRFVNNL